MEKLSIMFLVAVLVNQIDAKLSQEDIEMKIDSFLDGGPLYGSSQEEIDAFGKKHKKLIERVNEQHFLLRKFGELVGQSDYSLKEQMDKEIGEPLIAACFGVEKDDLCNISYEKIVALRHLIETTIVDESITLFLMYSGLSCSNGLKELVKEVENLHVQNELTEEKKTEMVNRLIGVRVQSIKQALPAFRKKRAFQLWMEEKKIQWGKFKQEYCVFCK